jgi:hypothetical protein
MADDELGPDSLARKIFWFTTIGALVCFVVVFLWILL